MDTVLFKGVSHRTTNSSKHIQSATFIPNKSSEDFANYGAKLPLQDFVFLTTELFIAAHYGIGNNGRIVTYRSIRLLKLFNMADYESVDYMIRRYNLTETDFNGFLKIHPNTKTVERTSQVEWDYKIVQNLTNSNFAKDFDGYVYDLTDGTDKHHPEVVVFCAENNLKRNNIEYRFTGLGYGGFVQRNGGPERKELHFLLIVDEIGRIIGTHFWEHVISVQRYCNPGFNSSHEVACDSEKMDAWLFELQKMPESTRYDTLVVMMNSLLPKFVSVFENNESKLFNYGRFDDKFTHMKRITV